MTLVFFLAFSLGCQERKAGDRDALEEGYKRIDQGQYDSAIQYLDDLQKTDSRPRVKEALASAYAARAGVKVENFWDFAQMLKAPPVTQEKIQTHPLYLRSRDQMSVYGGAVNTQLKKDIELLSKVMSAFEMYQVHLQSLPFVAREPREDLKKAVTVLKGVETRGGHLYSAALNLVILRSELSEGLEVWETIENSLKSLNTKNPKDPRNQEILCGLDLEIYQAWLSLQFDRIKDISVHLKRSYPSKIKELIVFDFAVSAMQRQLPGVQKSLRCQ